MPVFKTKNEHFFKRWSPEMAYILGFFCADGAMTVNPRGSQYIDIAITDLELLESFRNRFGSNHKISERAPETIGSKTRYRLQIGSKIMFEDLLRLGITPRKTFRFRLPKMAARYFADFTRGYFDGDGNVWCGVVHKERRTPGRALLTVFTSGNKKFLRDLAGRLRSAIDISGFMNYHAHAYRLTYSIHASLSLYKFMYNDANLFLNRKRQVFERYIHGPVV